MVPRQTAQSRIPPMCTNTGEKGDETLSLAASNLLFQGNENKIQKYVQLHNEKEDGNISSASGSTHDEDQKYWLQSAEEYNDVVKIGTKVSSSMASATKIFSEIPLSEDKLKSKIESGKLPVNCGFMETKRCNTEVWVTMGDQIRSQDFKLQEVQKLLAASASHILQASSELTNNWCLLNSPQWTHLMLKSH